MPTYDYKCPRCEERHRREVPPERFDETYHAPCPVCGFVARRMPASAAALPEPVPHVEPAVAPI